MEEKKVERILRGISELKAALSGGVTVSENLAQVNGVTVNVGTGTAGLGTQRVSVSSDSTIITKGDVADNAVQVNLNPSYVGGKAVDTASYAPAYTAGDSAGLAVDKDNGGLLVNQANLSLTTDAVGNNQISTTSAVGALTKFRSLVNSSTGEVVKASTGNLYRYNVVNKDTNIIYVKFYDKATAATSADTPFLVISCATGVGSRASDEFVIPDNLANGLSVRTVTGVLDNDTTNPGTSPILEIRYK